MSKNDQVLKNFDAAQKSLDEARKGYLALLNAAQANEPEEEEEDAAAEQVERIIYWDADDVDNNTNLEEMDLKALKAFAKEQSITISASKDADVLRDEIYFAIYPGETAEDEEAGEEESEAEAEEVSTVIVLADADDNEVTYDLAEMSLKEIKELAKVYGVTISAKAKDGAIQEFLDVLYANADEEADAEEDAAAEEAEEEVSPADFYGLTDMENDQLVEILTSFGLSPKGKREALIDRVLKGIEDGTIPIEGE